jgi:hypothetical protein
MPVDLDRDDSIGTWTPHPEYAKGTYLDGDEWYKIRPLSSAMLNHFTTTTTTQVRDRSGILQAHHDEKRYAELMADHLIEEWKLKNTAGVEWPCTLENKVKLWGGSLDRQNWLVTTGKLYADNEVARQDAERVAFQKLGPTAPGHAVVELSGVSEPA